MHESILCIYLQGLDDANASFSSGGGTGASTSSGGGGMGGNGGGGKNNQGGKNSRGDLNSNGGNNNSSSAVGKTFHVEGFEGMEFTGNMDVVADGNTVGNVTNIAASSSSSSDGTGSGDSPTQAPMRFKERMTNKHMGPSYIDPLPSHFPGTYVLYVFGHTLGYTLVIYDGHVMSCHVFLLLLHCNTTTTTTT